ncbi:hypothetical protein SLA2020_292320 [Shorea laevis]
MESSQPKETTVLTTEERANLERSRRKSKRPRGLDLPIDEALDGLSIIPEINKVVTGSPEEAAAPDPVKPKVSYKEKLTNGRVDKRTNADGREDEWKDWLDSEEDDQLLEKFEATDGEQKEYPWPNVTFTKEEKEIMWKPWRKALIIRPLHHSIGYKVLCDRAKALWKLEGEFHALDLGYGCFLFRFSKRQDYKNVLLGGPWNVGGYCVVVRRWNPWFDPAEDVLEKVNAWVRVSRIPVWCYNPIGLKRIGDKLGKVLKIDHSTQYV